MYMYVGLCVYAYIRKCKYIIIYINVYIILFIYGTSIAALRHITTQIFSQIRLGQRGQY